MRPHPVVTLLMDLGSTPDEIADALEKEGVKGIMGDSCACPLARYLAKHGYRAAVDDLSIALLDEDESWATSIMLEQFINDFDEGKYPALVEA